MLSRYVTSLIANLLDGSPSRAGLRLKSLRCFESRLFHATSMLEKKKSRFWKKKDTGPKIIRPYDCADSPKPMCDPKCKIAIVVGGSDGFGFAAANQLLCKGARHIVIVDNDRDQGQMAARRLCSYHGKDRVMFLEGDIRQSTHFEVEEKLNRPNENSEYKILVLPAVSTALKQIVCRHKRVDIIFNDLDREWHRKTKSCTKPLKHEVCYCYTKSHLHNNSPYLIIALRVGLQILGKDQDGFGGVIVNCSSIFGFLGWPQDPFPVYCRKEPVIEITMDFAKEFPVKTTGVRLISLCPSVKAFSEIGLPEIPEAIPNKCMTDLPCCIPPTKYQIGPALSHVLGWADSGSVWLVEPAYCPHKIPRLIHFPALEGEKVDPKVYETQPCSVITRSPCVDTSGACSLADSKICKIDAKSVLRKKIGIL
ncbi:uncharacterized protein LOC143186668 [Calliopsis andreniformis]|uniref:uncharacterized protein LOC143186668 n=1 Tax=Calliopsis andreniformis TaxID=337506 RepID=UPI003FCC774A